MRPVYNLRFDVHDSRGDRNVADIDVDVNEEGRIMSLYLNGEDFTYSRAVISAVESLLGEQLKRRVDEELGVCPVVDKMAKAKAAAELAKENEK